jgi:hypothetical protein
MGQPSHAGDGARWFVGYALVGVTAFSISYEVRRDRSNVVQASVTAELPDSAQLARAGFGPGRQLIAYVFVSSTCAFSQSKDVKRAVHDLRATLAEMHGGEFRRIAVIGVGVDHNVETALSYFRSVSLDSFDEIDAGGSWLNEQVVRHIWRERETEASVPQVVLVSRRMDATLKPFSLSLGDDSILVVLRGRNHILEWLAKGVPLVSSPNPDGADSGLTSVRRPFNP